MRPLTRSKAVRTLAEATGSVKDIADSGARAVVRNRGASDGLSEIFAMEPTHEPRSSGRSRPGRHSGVADGCRAARYGAPAAGAGAPRPAVARDLSADDGKAGVPRRFGAPRLPSSTTSSRSRTESGPRSGSERTTSGWRQSKRPCRTSPPERPALKSRRRRAPTHRASASRGDRLELDLNRRLRSFVA